MVEIPQKDAEAIDEMVKRGLQLVKVDSEERMSEWRATADSFAASMHDGIVPPEIFDAALRHRSAFRRNQASEAHTESGP